MLGAWRRFWLQRRMRKQAAASARPSSRRELGLFGRLLAFPGKLSRALALSVRSLSDSLASKRRSWRDLLLGLPAVVLFIGFVAATAVGSSEQSSSGPRYWQAGERLLAAGDAEDAQTFLQKAMLSRNVSRRDAMFSLARSYELAEQFDRADALMSILAGVGEEGYPAAHRYLAIRTSIKVQDTKQVENLEAWFWHLSHADQVKSAPLQKAWGTYFLVGGDLENAILHFRNAAEEEPALWLQVAELEARRNDIAAVRKTLAIAVERLERQFIRDPGNSENRLLYATSLFYVGQLPDAERLLKEGLQAEDNESFRQLLAAVFTRMYDAEVLGDGGVQEAFRFLRLALDYEPGYQPALSRLVKFARSSPERLESSRDAMRQLIASGNSSAMAHFTLGTLEWIAGNPDLALLNMRQAMRLDDKMPVISNNVAFLMSQEEDPNLDAALSLAEQAVEAEPQNAEFRDTRATILTLRGDLADAAADYQQALDLIPESPKSNELRLKLAAIYDQLGDPQMANQFRELANSPDPD